PQGDRAQEDFQWIVREIAAQGGDASVCEARFVDGLSDEHVEAMFHAARDAEYGEIAEGARRLVDGLRKADAAPTSEIAPELDRLRRRLAGGVDIEFLAAPAPQSAES